MTRKGKSCPNPNPEAGKIQSYRNVALNHVSCKSILTECRDVNEIISLAIINHFLFFSLCHHLIKEVMKNDNLIVNLTRFHFLEMLRFELGTSGVGDNYRNH